MIMFYTLTERKAKHMIHVIFVFSRVEPAILRNCWEMRKNQPQDILFTFHQKLALPIRLKSPFMAVTLKISCILTSQ